MAKGKDAGVGSVGPGSCPCPFPFPFPTHRQGCGQPGWLRRVVRGARVKGGSWVRRRVVGVRGLVRASPQGATRTPPASSAGARSTSCEHPHPAPSRRRGRHSAPPGTLSCSSRGLLCASTCAAGVNAVSHGLERIDAPVGHGLLPLAQALRARAMHPCRG